MQNPAAPGMSFYRGRHVLSAKDLDYLTRHRIFQEALVMEQLFNDPSKRHLLGKVLRLQEQKQFRFALYFWTGQASTRTRESFVAAVDLLGGEVHVTPEADRISSMAKGEIMVSTMQSLWAAAYDCLIVRYGGDDPRALYKAADASEDQGLGITVINAGDRTNEHPTQMLLDLFTIYKKKQRALLEGRLTFALVGDVLRSRTIRSLVIALADYGGKIFFVMPEEENPPADIMDVCKASKRLQIEKRPTVVSCPIGEIDVWYFTRLQEEYRGLQTPTPISSSSRFFSDEEKQESQSEEANLLRQRYIRDFCVDEEFVRNLKKDAIVMHPYPHGPEYPDALIDSGDRRFVHREQMRNGLIVRMTLLKTLFAPNLDLQRYADTDVVIPISGYVVDFPTHADHVSVVCAVPSCSAVCVGAHWVRTSIALKHHLERTKPKVFCLDCRSLPR